VSNNVPINPGSSQQGQPEQGDSQNQANNRPKPINWKKARTTVAIAGIIEAVSLFLWQEAEDFNGVSAMLVHWVSKCGVLFGVAFAAHKYSNRPKTVWGSYVLLCLVVLVVGLLAKSDDLYSPLIPANDPMPPLPDGTQVYGIKPDSALVFFGGSVVGGSVHNNKPIPIVVTPDNSSGNSWRPLIKVSIKPNGATISGQFFDKDGKIVAVLRDNKPIVNVANSFDVQRPDASTLIVHDQYDAEVLNIRFLRPSVFSFTGIIRSPDGAEVVVTKSYTQFTKGMFQGKFIGSILDGCGIYLSLHAEGMGFIGPISDYSF